MAKVAVAGGTGGAGLHIVEAIVATGKHEVVVLSRKSESPQVEGLGARLITVSYSDPESLLAVLDGVHTVIVTINGFDEDATIKPQLALIDAAVKAGVKRFAPSEFLTRSRPNDPIQLFALQCPVEDAVAKSGLEYTFFKNGIFMNYLSSGTPGTGYLLKPYKFLFDIENCKAGLPGDGSQHVVYTRIEDVAMFVAESLDLPNWPEVSQMRGEHMTLNEILQLAEEIRGLFNPTIPHKNNAHVLQFCRSQVRRHVHL